MFWSNKHSRPPIGVDVGCHQLKAVQLDHFGQSILAAAIGTRAEAAVPSPREVQQFSAVLEHSGFRGNRLVLAAPSDKIISAVLELPRASAIPIEQLARMEVARSHKCHPDAMEVGCWELPAAARADKSVQVMAAACRHEETTPLLDAFESQGFEVVAVDLKSCALARVLSVAGPGKVADDQRSVTAILDLGWSAATLVLHYRQTIVYERRISEGCLKKLHEQLRGRLKIDASVADYLLMDRQADEEMPDDARGLVEGYIEMLTSELTASFAYAAHQYHDAPVAGLHLCGPGAAIRDIDQILKGQLSMDVNVLRPATMFKCPTEWQAICESPAMTAATGLAMFSSSPGRGPLDLKIAQAFETA